MMSDAIERWTSLTESADRCDALADTAELMGDDAGAERFRALATERRLLAMSLFDQDAD